MQHGSLLCTELPFAEKLCKNFLSFVLPANLHELIWKTESNKQSLTLSLAVH